MKQNVLVVDDEEDLREILEFNLLGLGIDLIVHHASDPVAALDLMEKHKIDLVISDYLMPNMDGLSFLKAIRNSGDHVPFIFISGNMDQAKQNMAISFGAIANMEKPMDESHFSSIILNLLKV